MKLAISPRCVHGFFACAALFIAVSDNQALATTRYFDVNDVAAGSGVTNAGSYSWEGNFWNSNDALGTTAATAWTDGDFAKFSAGTDANVASYTVTASAVHTVNGFQVSTAATSPATTTVNINTTGSGVLNVGTGLQGVFVVTQGTLKITAPLGGVDATSAIQWSGGGGSLNLYGANTFAGGVSLNSVNGLNFNNNSSFGTGPISWNVATQVVAAPDATVPINIGNTMTTRSASTLIMASFAQPVTWSGGWTLATGGNSTLDVRSGVVTTISGVIAGTDTASGFLKGGASTSTGILTLSNANTYVGPTTVGVGTVSVSNIGNSGANSNLGRNGTINLGGGATTTTTGILKYTGTGEISDKVLNLGGTTGGGTIDQSGTGLLKFTSNMTATGAGIKTLTLQGSTAGTGEIAGKIVDNSATNKTSVTKAGSGKWTLSNANTYTGGTTISAGTLGIGNSSALGTGTFTFSAGGTFDNTSGSTLSLSNAVALSGGSPTFTGTNDMTLTGPVALSGSAGNNRTITVTNAGATLAVNGVISDGGTNMGVTKAGAGTLVLGNANNSATASFRTNAGVLSVSGVGNSGSNSSLGTNGTFNFGGGTLQYTGTGETSNKVLNLIAATAGGTLDQSGTGLLKFTSDMTATANGVKTLTLQGSTAGTGELAGKIVDSTSATSVAKSGSGTWVLSGANVYSGGTTVSAGTLLANNTSGSATGTGAITVNGGTFGGTGAVSGAVTVNNGATLSPGASVAALGTGALTFNTGSNLLYEIDSSAALSAGADLLNSSGALAIAPGVTLTLNDVASTPGSISAGSKFTMISYSGAWDGDTFNGVPDDSVIQIGGTDFSINYNDISGGSNFGGGTNNTFVTLTAVPEANAFWLGGTICLVLGLTICTRKLIGNRAVA
jgi:fibronectin-binding autotransporter adhesin